MPKQETILAIKSSTLDALLQNIIGNSDVYGTLDNKQFIKLTSEMNSRLWFGPREELETNYEFRQIIPYIIISNGQRIAVYQRSSSHGDNRLHNLYSIGFGGHVKIQDIDPYDLILLPFVNVNKLLSLSITRELTEELVNINEIKEKDIKIIGFIKLDDHTTNSVNSVHFGIVMYYENIQLKLPKTNQDGMKHFELINYKDVLQNFNNDNNKLEDWSLIALNLLGKINNE